MRPDCVPRDPQVILALAQEGSGATKGFFGHPSSSFHTTHFTHQPLPDITRSLCFTPATTAMTHCRKPPDGRSLQNMPILSSNAEKDAMGKAAALPMQQH